jgi:hypothetical protein
MGIQTWILDSKDAPQKLLSYLNVKFFFSKNEKTTK